MSIGAGIAIFGIWLLPLASLFAPQVTGIGLCICIAGALVATMIVCS